jgi:hypothetical protein
VTADDHWSCRTTRDLSSVFKRPASRLHTTDDRFVSREAIPGIVLSVEGVPTAAIGFQQEADHTLSLSSPLFLTDSLSESHRTRMFALMLKTAEVETIAAKCSRIRFLQSATESSDMPWMQGVLQNSSFALVARIALWTSTVSLSTVYFSSASPSSLSPNASALEHQQSSVVRYETLRAQSIQSSTEQGVSLSRLLRSILSDSGDLSGMQPANAESLLNDWAAQNAFLVVVHRDSVAVAICACVVQAERPSANIADVHIHYVGVHPTFRRLKIAATLLKQLPAILQSSFPPSEQAVRLTAFGDLANEAATALYTSCRFSSGETSVVWQRCLAKS